MFLEAKRHRENYERQFYRLQNVKQGRAHVFRGKIEIIKI